MLQNLQNYGISLRHVVRIYNKAMYEWNVINCPGRVRKKIITSPPKLKKITKLIRKDKTTSSRKLGLKLNVIHVMNSSNKF